MAKEEAAPSESEWMIMEILWEAPMSLTSSEIIQKLQKNKDMAPKMVRVLLNRLCRKNLVVYTLDPDDARVYHYSPVKKKEECLRERTRKFTESYFSGNGVHAVAAFLQNVALTEEQMQELREILNTGRGEKD